jgi:hypothetical protein
MPAIFTRFQRHSQARAPRVLIPKLSHFNAPGKRAFRKNKSGGNPKRDSRPINECFA